MKNSQAILQLIGLSTRARKLISGTDTVLRAIRSQKASLVLIATDTGDATKKKITDKCRFYNISYDASFSKQQLNQATGQTNTIYAVMDHGFAKKMKELLQM